MCCKCCIAATQCDIQSLKGGRSHGHDWPSRISTDISDIHKAVNVPASCKTHKSYWNNITQKQDECEVSCKEGYTKSNGAFKADAKAVFTCASHGHDSYGEWKLPSEEVLECNRA